MRILIADDHEVVRRGIRAIIEGRADLQVCGQAAAGREVIEKVTRLKPDVLLLDIALPDVSGIELIPEITASAPKTAILILTMHESGGLAARALAAGARGLVLKSDAGRDLLRGLDAVAKGRQFMSPRVTQLILDEIGTPGEAMRSPGVLTRRETEIVRLLAEGRRNREISGLLGISSRTVDAHRANIMRKLNIGNISDLIRFAIRNRLVEI